MENIAQQQSNSNLLNFSENRVLARQFAEKLPQEDEPTNTWVSAWPRGYD